MQTALDTGDITVLTLLDLSAAFDTIEHSILLDSNDTLVSSYGIIDTSLTWLKGYLTNQTQSVHIDNHKSQSSPLAFGVLQGSVLGPVLFIM